MGVYEFLILKITATDDIAYEYGEDCLALICVGSNNKSKGGIGIVVAKPRCSVTEQKTW